MDFTIDALRQVAPPLDLGASSWVTIDQSRINAFADATEDHQWIHLDAERARDTPFGGTIAHGFLLLSLVPRLFGDLFRVTDADMLVNYGLDKVRFIQPVASGSALSLAAKVEKVTEKGGRLLVRIRGNLLARPSADPSVRGRRAVALEMLFLIVPPAL